MNELKILLLIVSFNVIFILYFITILNNLGIGEDFHQLDTIST